MTKIKNYPIDTNISKNDKWIGSDAQQSNKTKNFSVAGLFDYLNSSGSVDLANTLMFKYDTIDIGENRKSGTFSFETEVGATVPFSSITNLVFSKKTFNNKDVVDLMTLFSGNIILIQKTDKPNIFAFYKVNSYTQNLVETNFYNTSLTYISGNGSIEEDEFYFISLLQFDDLSQKDKNYVHSQDVAASVWNVSHNLLKFPSVSVALSTGQKGYGDITYINENNLTITFASAESGKAYIN